MTGCLYFLCGALTGWRTLRAVSSRSIRLAAVFAVVAIAACKQEQPAAAQHAHSANSAESAEARATPGAPITVRVDGSGYHPARIRAAANSDVTLSFLRTTDECCGQQLKIPALNIERDLPLNQAVAVAVHVPANGELSFTCGMGMYRGAVVVQ